MTMSLLGMLGLTCAVTLHRLGDDTAQAKDTEGCWSAAMARVHIPCSVFRGSPAHAAASGCGLLTRQHRSTLILATWSGGPRNFGGSRELGKRARGKQHGLDWFGLDCGHPASALPALQAGLCRILLLKMLL